MCRCPYGIRERVGTAPAGRHHAPSPHARSYSAKRNRTSVPTHQSRCGTREDHRAAAADITPWLALAQRLAARGVTTRQGAWAGCPHPTHARDRRGSRARPATRGCTRSSGTGCGCSSTCATGRVTVWSRNERDVTAAYPELEELGARLRRHAARRRGRRPRRRDARASTPSPSGCTSPTGAGAPAPGRHPAGDPHGLRPAAPLRLRPHRPAVVGPARAARTARPRRPALAGARGLRGRGAAARGDRATRASRASSASAAPPPTPRAAAPPDWRKTAHRASLSVVVGGWRPEVGSTGRLGRRARRPARRPRRLAVCRSRRARDWPAPRARRSRCGCAPCAATPRRSPTRCPAIDADGTTWVEPRLVVEVRALELTGQHRLRQPAYLGVRTDLSPADLEEVDDA